MKKPQKMKVVEGLGVANGIGIGPAVCVASRTADVFRLPVGESGVEHEIERLRSAVTRASEELETTRQRAGRELGEELAAIFEAHTLMLDDSAFLGRIERRIREEEVNAEWAVHSITDELEKRFESLESPEHKARGEDLLDVAQYLLRFLAGATRPQLGDLQEDVVVVADDLTPSEAVRLGRERVVGFALENGGPTSHTTIIARSLHLPVVAGLENVVALVKDQDRIIIDGYDGKLILAPTPEVISEYQERKNAHAAEVSLRTRSRDVPAVTRDGVEIQLLANIDLPEEVDEAVDFGARGIGLYRSEFLYIERSPDLPSEDEHVELYGHLLRTMAPHQVTIRTFDLGGRKLASEVLETREANPVLGLRGIRLTLARPDIFKIQIRALLRAGCEGDLKIMIPMVSSLEEVLQFKQLLNKTREELHREGLRESCPVKLGVMIEVPSAALIADSLAKEVDFFSIGTNDLIQYSMAVDRSNEHVSYLHRPLHPAILRLIRLTVESAAGAGIDVSICGEMAGNPRYIPLLVGLGLRTLSASPRAIPKIKKRIREINAAEWRQKSLRCLDFATADAVSDLLELDNLPKEVAS
jgi:phosphotransferase system enzyme I (PtsI)